MARGLKVGVKKISVKQLPWVSLALLVVCYISFGWYLAGLPSPKPSWLIAECYQMFGETMPNKSIQPQSTVGQERSHSSESPTLKSSKPLDAASSKSSDEAQSASPHTPAIAETHALKLQPKNFCKLALDHNLFAAILAISWIVVSAIAFMSPLTSFSTFITRWFHSDTVAFTAIFLFAALAAVMLFWLHVFTQILTILAAETLARIDLQIRDINGLQSFWLLTTVCLFGLLIGWVANTLW